MSSFVVIASGHQGTVMGVFDSWHEAYMMFQIWSQEYRFAMIVVD